MPNNPAQNDYSEFIAYLDEKFSAVDRQFEEVKKGFNDLQTSVDAYAKKADTYFQEMVMLSRKVDRLEKWVLQVAAKLQMRLEP